MSGLDEATRDGYIDTAERAHMIGQLVAVRERAGLSVEQVAEQMEAPPEQVYAYEACVADPTLSFHQRYARTVGVPLRVEIEADDVP